MLILLLKSLNFDRSRSFLIVLNICMALEPVEEFSTSASSTNKQKGADSSLSVLPLKYEEKCTASRYKKEAPCGPGYERTPVVEICLYFSKEAANHYTASVDCTDKGGYLLYINDAKTDAEIGKKLSSDVWLGITRRYQQPQWQNSKVANYTNWKSPNAARDPYACFIKKKDGGRWAAVGCKETYKYICARDSLESISFTNVKTEVTFSGRGKSTTAFSGDTAIVTCNFMGRRPTTVQFDVNAMSGPLLTTATQKDKRVQIIGPEYIVSGKVCVRRTRAVFRLKTSISYRHANIKCCGKIGETRGTICAEKVSIHVKSKPEKPNQVVRYHGDLLTITCSGYIAESSSGWIEIQLASGGIFQWIISGRFGKVLSEPPYMMDASVQNVSVKTDDGGFYMTSVTKINMKSKFDGSKTICSVSDVDKRTFRRSGERLRSKPYVWPKFRPASLKMNHTVGTGAMERFGTVGCSGYVGSAGVLTWLFSMGKVKVAWTITDDVKTPTANCLGVCYPADINSKATYSREKGAHISSTIKADVSKAKTKSSFAVFTCMLHKLKSLEENIVNRKIVKKSVHFDYRSGVLQVRYRNTTPNAADESGSVLSTIHILFFVWCLVMAGLLYYKKYVMVNEPEPEQEAQDQSIEKSDDADETSAL